jgi:histidinol-phosphate aminotransferase
MGYFRPNVEETAGYVPGFQPKEADVVKLNTNENPYPPSPQVLKALASIKADQLRRYPDPIGDQFRAAASQVHGVSADHILCVNGGDELLAMAVRAFCDGQHALAYPVPTYSLYPVLARLQDCQAIEVPFDAEFNLPAKLATTGAALTIVCNPNAPSGSLISAEELASLADELDGVLLIDEAYVDFSPCHCLGLVKDFDKVVVLRTLSKGYSLAGLRFGYAIAQPSLIEGLLKVKDSYNVDAVSIALATAAIQDQAYHKETIEKVKAARQDLTGQLRDLGFEVRDSHSNFLMATCLQVPAADLQERLAAKHIYVRYFNLPGLTDKLRISVGTPQQNARLVAAIREILGAGVRSQ